MLTPLLNMISHHPNKILDCEKLQNAENYAIIVLNRPINAEPYLVERLWNFASIRILVDGGSNRWLSWIRKYKLENKLKQPNLITGDLDSCFKETLTFFNESRVIKTVNQDKTDFTKSLEVLEPFLRDMKIENIIALCENSGRLDQILANINTLFLNQQKPSDLARPLFILSANSLSWLLSTGCHSIHIPENFKKLWCSLIPFQPSVVSTSGLRWNLTNDTMNFGGIISTSNTYDQTKEIVTIETDRSLLWTMGISKIDD